MAEKKYIDADLLQSQIEEMGLSNGVVLGHHSGVADIIADMISNTSPADVAEVRHGKWEQKPEVDAGLGCFYECVNCGFVTRGCEYYYCPNCGARMDGDAN